MQCMQRRLTGLWSKDAITTDGGEWKTVGNGGWLGSVAQILSQEISVKQKFFAIFENFYPKSQIIVVFDHFLADIFFPQNTLSENIKRKMLLYFTEKPKQILSLRTLWRYISFYFLLLKTAKVSKFMYIFRQNFLNLNTLFAE